MTELEKLLQQIEDERHGEYANEGILLLLRVVRAQDKALGSIGHLPPAEARMAHTLEYYAVEWNNLKREARAAREQAVRILKGEE